ncbi:MAG: class I SAM-dependent methyltransferase [Alphaproteobacteria bacterium]
MAERQIRFEDGAAYERMMGVWSRSVGEVFLDWVAPPIGLRWVDIGCGNGAFTELMCARCAPCEIHGIDPSDAQLAFARTQPGARGAQFHQGDAMALPFPDDSFDAAAMALVIFFVPDPAKGVAEMIRVVRPGGIVAAYVWDMLGGGYPMRPVQQELRAMGFNPPLPPSVGVSRMESLRDLWVAAGLDGVETREIAVTRTFPDFDDLWETSLLAPALATILASLPADDIARLKSRTRELLPPNSAGRVTCAGRANAVKGRVPK